MNPTVSLEQTAPVNFEVVPPVPDRDELEVVSEHRRHWRDADILAHQHEASQLSPRVGDELTRARLKYVKTLLYSSCRGNLTPASNIASNTHSAFEASGGVLHGPHPSLAHTCL
jgi:hypothetical protein